MVIANDHYQYIGIVSNQRAFNVSRVSSRSALIVLCYMPWLCLQLLRRVTCFACRTCMQQFTWNHVFT